MPSVSNSPENQPLRDAAIPTNNSTWRGLLPHRLAELVLLTLVVLVISIQLKYLWDVRTTVPHQDDWNLLDNMFRALDEQRVAKWVFNSPNGHFMVPGALAFLVSLRCLSLDLGPLRLLNFPVCLAAFFLIAHVINIGVNSRFLRFYLYLGACFTIFNLSPWAHFTLAFGFTTLLSTLLGGIGLYYIAKAEELSWKERNNLAVGFGFLVASILSFGAGYPAAIAAIVVLGLSGLKKLTVSRPISRYAPAIYCLTCALGLLVIVSHPLFHLKSRIIQAVFHTALVAGSIGPSPFDGSSLVTQNIAFACGFVLVVASLSIGSHFLLRQASQKRPLPIFALGLALFGLLGCAAVAGARSQLPAHEFLNTRYTLYPSICLLGTLLYFACSRIFLLTHIWCFAAALYVVATAKELQIAPYRPAVYEAIELSMKNIDTLSDDQLRASLYWQENTPGVRRVVARMHTSQLNIFRPGSVQK